MRTIESINTIDISLHRGMPRARRPRMYTVEETVCLIIIYSAHQVLASFLSRCPSIPLSREVHKLDRKEVRFIVII